MPERQHVCVKQCLASTRISSMACTMPQVEKPPARTLPGVKQEPEVVRCFCGATSTGQAPEGFSGLWLQCDRCGCWQHGECVGHPSKAPEGTPGRMDPLLKVSWTACTVLRRTPRCDELDRDGPPSVSSTLRSLPLLLLYDLTPGARECTPGGAHARLKSAGSGVLCSSGPVHCRRPHLLFLCEGARPESGGGRLWSHPDSQPQLHTGAVAD